MHGGRHKSGLKRKSAEKSLAQAGVRARRSGGLTEWLADGAVNQNDLKQKFIVLVHDFVIFVY